MAVRFDFFVHFRCVCMCVRVRVWSETLCLCVEHFVSVSVCWSLEMTILSTLRCFFPFSYAQQKLLLLCCTTYCCESFLCINMKQIFGAQYAFWDFYSCFLYTQLSFFFYPTEYFSTKFNAVIRNIHVMISRMVVCRCCVDSNEGL